MGVIMVCVVAHIDGSSFPKASCVTFHRPIWTGKEGLAEKFLEFFLKPLQKLIALIHKGVPGHMQLLRVGSFGQSIRNCHENLVALRVRFLKLCEQAVQDQGVDIDLCGQLVVRKKAGAGNAILVGIFHLNFNGEMLGSVLRDTAEFADIAKAVTLIAFFKWNAAGSGSLFCLAGSTHEPLPVTLLFWGYLDPLLERTVVDG